MTSEFCSIDKVRFLTSSTNIEDEDEWIWVLEGLPKEGEKVLCYGNKTICCELDMEDPAEHEATYRLEISSYRLDEKGNKIDVKTYHKFDLDDDIYHLIFVSRWKRIKK